MKAIKFIVPYYGTFPANFKEWVYTAGKLENQNIYFLFFSDLDFPCEIPRNFEVVRMSFNELKELFQRNFDFAISLDSPYKFCDFRPSFGEVFAEYLKDADFWGHCDVDMVWGDVKSFITEETLSMYDKVQYMGHFVLYRNDKQVNSLYKKSGALYPYKTVFSSKEFYSFDEHPGIMSIIIKNPIKTYISTNQADFSPAYKRLVVSRKENYDYQIFCWIDGHIYRYYVDLEGHLGRDEFMYAHFQKKKIYETRMPSVIDGLNFIISTKGFKIIDREIDVEFVKEESDFISKASDELDIKKYRKGKIADFIKCSIKKKIIWIKIKLYTRKVNDYFKSMIMP
ncbi:DUF6625 family protein [Sporofaciens sp. SGI.106]|uniref:DUF6625 family protein n=1 Tax=Sporofaciens sp. SGI.106 TaxID=3420568 RepID=UPI003CFE8C0F